MAIHRIHITGASGSGTTTLGQALSQKLQCPLLDADDYFWLPTTLRFRQKRDKTERLTSILNDSFAQPSSIISGSIVGWGETLEQSFDLVIFLLIPPDLRMERLRRREIERNGCFDKEFLEWAARYDTGDITVRSRMLHEKWLAERRCPILRLEGDLSVDQRVSQTLDFIAQRRI